MEKEPRSFVIRADHPLELKGAYAFLAGRHQLRGESPFAQWYLAPLHDGSNRHGERLAAVLTFIDARAGALTFEFGDPIAFGITAWTSRAIRPKQGFKIVPRRVVVVVDRISEVDFRYRHDFNSSFESHSTAFIAVR